MILFFKVSAFLELKQWAIDQELSALVYTIFLKEFNNV